MCQIMVARGAGAWHTSKRGPGCWNGTHGQFLFPRNHSIDRGLRNVGQHACDLAGSKSMLLPGQLDERETVPGVLAVLGLFAPALFVMGRQDIFDVVARRSLGQIEVLRKLLEGVDGFFHDECSTKVDK